MNENTQAQKATFRRYMGNGDKTRYKLPTTQSLERGKVRRKLEDYLEAKRLKQELSDNHYASYEELI